jgi:UDP-N-acetyl-D-glucosamine dehydrogenase
VAGRDFFLAFSPERVDPGNTKWTTRNVPKVVGGVTPVCTALARDLYAASIDTVIEVSSPKVAEMVKLLENTFRAVNIGLVNELALMCDRLGISVWEVVEAAATKPFGFMPFYPGPRPRRTLHSDRSVLPLLEGQGGRVRGALHRAGRPRERRDAASRRPENRGRAEHARQGRARLACAGLGVSYKRDIDDFRESPAMDVMAELTIKGARVEYHDPYVPALAAHDWPGGEELLSVPLTTEALERADCVVILTDHRAFDYGLIAKHARLIVDSRNAIKGAHPHVFKLGAPTAKPV